MCPSPFDLFVLLICSFIKFIFLPSVNELLVRLFDSHGQNEKVLVFVFFGGLC